jgi:hypothetical protein
MTTNKERVEAPLVEERVSHYIKPKRIKAPKRQDPGRVEKQAHPAAEQGTVIAPAVQVGRQEKHKGVKRALTEKHKKKLRDARIRKRMKMLKSKSVSDNSRETIPLGRKMNLGVSTKKPEKSIQETPSAHQKREDDHDAAHIDIGTQIHHPDGNFWADILDHSALDKYQGMVNQIEHSSADRATATFIPAKTPFNNIIELRKAQAGEWPVKATSDFNIVQKSTVPELAKYESMLDQRGMFEGASLTRRNPPQVRPGYDLSTIQSAPHMDDTAFIRSFNGSQTGLRDSAGDVRVHS